MGPFEKKHDLEDQPTSDVGVGYVDENVVHKEEFTAGDSMYAKMQRFAGKFGVEQRGIERVPVEERTDTGMSKIGTLVRIPIFVNLTKT
jgi:hypothetical protein